MFRNTKTTIYTEYRLYSNFLGFIQQIARDEALNPEESQTISSYRDKIKTSGEKLTLVKTTVIEEELWKQE